MEIYLKCEFYESGKAPLNLREEEMIVTFNSKYESENKIVFKTNCGEMYFPEKGKEWIIANCFDVKKLNGNKGLVRILKKYEERVTDILVSLNNLLNQKKGYYFVSKQDILEM